MRAWLWSVPPDNYPVYVKTGTFAVRRVGRKALEKIRSGDVIFAYLSGSRVIAGMFEAVGRAFHDATPLVAGGHYPHRLRVRPIVALSKEAWLPYEAFSDQLEVVGEYPDFRAVVQQVVHPLPRVDEKVLAFLVRARQGGDLEQVLSAYDAYLQAREARARLPMQAAEPAAAYAPDALFDPAAAMEQLLAFIEGQGFVYQPWEVAAYVAALRTKPFVILAGVTGTGKSRLPALVAAGTGSRARVVPVRPDWTDSADVLGYVDLQGRFRPGAVLEVAREAMETPDRYVACVLDEMNLARVEHYLAEVLSRMEGRRPAPGGGFESPPLLAGALRTADPAWSAVRLPSNLGLVGTVNMDESAHGFSRKVLDRAFTLELADVDLTARAGGEAPPARWPVSAWHPRLPDDDAYLDRAVEALSAVNTFLAPAQLQVAYRTRDEVAGFLRHAAEVEGAFRDREGVRVDPLDLALHMKVLPRLVGGSRTLQRALMGLLGWAVEGVGFGEEAAARDVVDAWGRAGAPNRLPDARFPRTAARLCLLWERLQSEGFAAYWV